MLEIIYIFYKFKFDAILNLFSKIEYLGRKLVNNLLEVYSQIFSLIFLHFQTLILLYLVLLIIISN